MSNTTPFNHNKIANSVSRAWKKSILNTILKNAKNAGYDTVVTKETIVIGKLDTDEIYLKALRGNGIWIVRYNTELFQDHP